MEEEWSPSPIQKRRYSEVHNIHLSFDDSIDDSEKSSREQDNWSPSLIRKKRISEIMDKTHRSIENYIDDLESDISNRDSWNKINEVWSPSPIKKLSYQEMLNIHTFIEDYIQPDEINRSPSCFHSLVDLLSENSIILSISSESSILELDSLSPPPSISKHIEREAKLIVVFEESQEDDKKAADVAADGARDQPESRKKKKVEVLQVDPSKQPSATGVRAREPLYDVNDERLHKTTSQTVRKTRSENAAAP